MTDKDTPSAIEFASLCLEHARHLENWLLSFLNVFLVITGALWGFVLQSSDLDPTLSSLIYSYHAMYCLTGLLFVVRLSANFRRHWETAWTLLRNTGFDQTVALFPEDSSGKVSGSGREGWHLLLTGKAFVVLLFATAAGADTLQLYALALSPSPSLQSQSLLAAVVVLLLFSAVAFGVYRLCSERTGVNSTKSGKKLSRVPKASQGVE